jgi:predicted TIM-barrel enzyme
MKLLIASACLLMTCTSFAKSTSACEKSFKAGMNSASIATIELAAEACLDSVVAICDALVEEAGGPQVGDGSYIGSACFLMKAYGSNKGVNKGKATAKCEKAHFAGSTSASTGDVAAAIEVCEESTDSICKDRVVKYSDGPGTGDADLIYGVCELQAAHGAYAEVTNK